MCDYCGHEFGANYLDSVCIDGYLWDADSCAADGFTHGGEWACPRCNTRQMLMDARAEAADGGCGVSMFTPWCTAVQWECAVRKALAENTEEARRTLAEMQPFETDDWPDRRAVYEGRASWCDTISVRIDPASPPMREEA